MLAFQLDHGIAPAGVVDSETQQAIIGSMKTAGDNGQSNTENVAVDNEENTIEETMTKPDDSISEAEKPVPDLSLGEKRDFCAGTAIADDFECRIRMVGYV